MASIESKQVVFKNENGYVKRFNIVASRFISRVTYTKDIQEAWTYEKEFMEEGRQCNWLPNALRYYRENHGVEFQVVDILVLEVLGHGKQQGEKEAPA